MDSLHVRSDRDGIQPIYLAQLTSSAVVNGNIQFAVPVPVTMRVKPAIEFLQGNVECLQLYNSQTEYSNVTELVCDATGGGFVALSLSGPNIKAGLPYQFRFVDNAKILVTANL